MRRSALEFTVVSGVSAILFVPLWRIGSENVPTFVRMLGVALLAFAVAWAFITLVRTLLVRLRVPEARVELSREVLHPGEAFELSLTQGGWFHLTDFRVRLVCEEQVTYPDKGETRTERVLRVDKLLEGRRDIQVGWRQPWVLHLRGALPEDAMHNFRARYNSVTWKLIVEGDLRAWPDFEREYELPVVPHGLEDAVHLAQEKGP
ncbi:hypothetical protein [Hyalangium versicolor]|uniref:hypothetical protein n=1 Tax=Hyalangium versicolor TaxID=2861190 RepID=UPI001CCA80D9|nr:hypothetical protein [Hyalangium versicolor]